MTQPYYADDSVTLYHGDCREITDWLAADVLITDPPYGVGGSLSFKGRAVDLRRGFRPTHAEQSWDADLLARDEALSMWGGRPYAVFGSPRRLDAAPSYREVPLVWDKGDTVGMGDTSFPWRPTYELIYVYGSGWSGYRGMSVLRFPHSPSAVTKVGHPTPKPVGLMTELVVRCTGTVADPFAGAGSTLLAAKTVQRRAIGVEIDERYCEIAAKRLCQEVLNFEVSA